jgi:hypothetical protein
LIGSSSCDILGLVYPVPAVHACYCSGPELSKRWRMQGLWPSTQSRSPRNDAYPGLARAVVLRDCSRRRPCQIDRLKNRIACLNLSRAAAFRLSSCRCNGAVCELGRCKHGSGQRIDVRALMLSSIEHRWNNITHEMSRNYPNNEHCHMGAPVNPNRHGQWRRQTDERILA